jgi:hypothetical protein
MTAPTYVTIAVAAEVARELPPDPEARAEVLALGLQQWRVRQALEAYRRGHGTLAYAAQAAGISIRQMIPLAYACGLQPRVEPEWLSSEPTVKQAELL